MRADYKTTDVGGGGNTHQSHGNNCLILSVFIVIIKL